MLGNNILARAQDNTALYGKSRYTKRGGNPDKGVFGKRVKASKRTTLRKKRK